MSSRVTSSRGSRWLTIGGCLSILAALLHVAVIFGGAEWYRFFGAGEEIAQAAERGSWMPPLVTLGITAVLLLWALYAFSGAGRFARMPLLRTGLVIISFIYLARGLLLFPVLVLNPQGVNAFGIWSSLVVLVYGLAYGVGTWLAWPAMSGRSVEAG